MGDGLITRRVVGQANLTFTLTLGYTNCFKTVLTVVFKGEYSVVGILHFVVFLWLLVFIGFNIILNLYLIFQCMNTLMNKYLNLLLWFIFMVIYG